MQSDGSSSSEVSSREEGKDVDESSFLASEEEEEESSDDDDNETTIIMSQRRNILFLCQEGQLRIAMQRFERLQNNNNQQLQKEIFQVDQRDKNYALHEILMGGTNDTNANLLSILLLDNNNNNKVALQTMLIAQPPSHGRTCLHWAAWGNASISLIRRLVAGNPEALVRKDKPDKGHRTPLEIYRHYYCNESVRAAAADEQQQQQISLQLTKEKQIYLESCTKSWIQHRLRLAVYGAVVFYFRHRDNDNDNKRRLLLLLTPFDKNDRKKVKIKPRPWFFISVLGYFLQREMQPLMVLTLAFVGKDAKVFKKPKLKKRKTANIQKSKKRKKASSC